MKKKLEPLQTSHITKS